MYKPDLPFSLSLGTEISLKYMGKDMYKSDLPFSLSLGTEISLKYMGKDISIFKGAGVVQDMQLIYEVRALLLA